MANEYCAKIVADHAAGKIATNPALAALVAGIGSKKCSGDEATLAMGSISECNAARAVAAAPLVAKAATQFQSIDEFLSAAKSIKLAGDGLNLVLAPREFASGSYGWGSSGKLAITLADGRAVKVQGSINLVVVGSKPEKAAA